MSDGTRGATRPLISGLTGIRSLAAAWVVIEHFRQPLFALAPASNYFAEYVRGGYLGVELFFILSGFIIAYNYADRFVSFTWHNYRQFLLLRLARIYPVHLATLSLVGLLVIAAFAFQVELGGQLSFSLLNFASNVFLLQAFPPFSAVNGPAWSIAAEFAAYLAFPLMAVWIASIRTALKGFTLAAVTILVFVGTMLLATHASESPTSYSMIWLRISTEFTIGCLLYSGWRHLDRSRRGVWWDWTILFAVVGIITTLAVVGGSTSTALFAVPFIAILVLSSAGATGFVGRFLGSRLMLWGGKVSYSVYMTHFIVLMIIGKLMPWQKFEAQPLPLGITILLGYFLAVVATGAAFFFLVEKPGRALLANLGVARNDSRAATAVVTHE
jgi:peptidoglycan/LPS O-acetylase OafA/YrhL